MANNLPPLQPTYVFRGHAAQIHALRFLRGNTRLLTGDADGWLILWDLVSKRAVAVWRAHTASLLGLGSWGDERVISHGRDGNLRVWQLKASDEKTLSTVLPTEDATTHRKEPWILHSLKVDTYNFCSFASCSEFASTTKDAPIGNLTIAVVGKKDVEVDVFHLPSENKLYTVPAPPSDKLGMVMAIAIFYRNQTLSCVTGYESGLTAVHQLETDSSSWQPIYMSRPHVQPILSLAMTPSNASYFTSGADAIIASHVIPFTESDDRDATEVVTASIREIAPAKIVETKHSGQQSLVLRSDGKILATAGWDFRARVYSVKTLRELAVLKWHKEGCYAVAFADVEPVAASQLSREAALSIESEANLPNDEGTQSRSITTTLHPGVPAFMTVRQQREAKVTQTHWLAAGSKDGKVSLWDVY